MKTIKKNNEFDEMQKQKRDRIGSRIFGILSWVVILVATLPMRPELENLTPMRWLMESGHNMGLTIAVIATVSWLIYSICLIKAGAFVPFREKPTNTYLYAAFGLIVGMFFSVPVGLAIAVVIIAFFQLVKAIDKMKTLEERNEEKLNKMKTEEAEIEEEQ